MGFMKIVLIVSDFSSMETCITEDGLTNYGFEKASLKKGIVAFFHNGIA
jgi:hypothetical protein